MLSERVASILREPVTLEPLRDIESRLQNGYVDLGTGAHSAKNLAELGFAVGEYTEPDGGTYVERLPHMSHPEIGEDDIVVDIGCGPRSFLRGLAGHHIFVDDLVGAYVERLGATFDGLAVNARSELLPFADNSVDIMYSINMLDHVDDLPETLFELHRVLSPDGVLVLQTYFNSHPLLHSEPGVVDRYAFDSLIAPYFEISQLRTHEVQSPEISSYYTMGIMTCHLRCRDVEIPRPDRNKYASQQYLGPQSSITEALDSISAGYVEHARALIETLWEREHYHFHAILLEAKLAISERRLADVLPLLKQAREHPRGQRNPYARIAIKDLEIERLLTAVEVESTRTEAARAGIDRRNSRIAELDRAIELRDARLAELRSAIELRDARIAELDGAVIRRDLRITELERVLAMRGKRLLELGSPTEKATPQEFDLRMATATTKISELVGRLEQHESARLPSGE